MKRLGKHIKKSVSILLSLTMIIGLFTIVPVATSAAISVSYIGEDGGTKNASSVTELTDGMTSLSGGWYAVTSDLTIGGRITCTGKVNLILCDGKTLTASKGIGVTGSGTSLTVYSQIGGTGSLVVNAADEGFAAIGSGKNYDGDLGNVTVVGGVLDVTGGRYAAGIGGGRNGHCGNILIKGGSVSAHGGEKGAGIGSGAVYEDCPDAPDNSSTITITGGTVNATGGTHGAGVGSGSWEYPLWLGEEAKIAISGGTVKAVGQDDTAAIGGNNCTIAVSGGNISAAPGGFSSDVEIKLSWSSFDDSIYSSLYDGEVRLLKKFKIQNEETYYDPGTIRYSLIEGKTLVPPYSNFTSVKYIDTDGVEKTVQKAVRIVGNTTFLDSGWYAATDRTSVDQRIVCSGNVRLVLCDDCALTALKGITVNEGDSLTIYRQAGGSGRLTATATENDLAGIGGEKDKNSGVITINGGVIEASSQRNSAGIGGGYNSAGTVNINGGNVTATGERNGAGIGGGYYGNGTVNITGGTVNATGGEYAAAIGGGSDANGIVTVGNANVTAKGKYDGAGIGGGFKGNGTVTINSGVINARGGGSGAGIGGGYRGDGNININGGEVTAIAGIRAAAIGSGYASLKSETVVNINGGRITAEEGGGDGAGIGVGAGGQLDCEINLSWTNALDSIKSDNYKGFIKIKKAFVNKANSSEKFYGGTVYGSGEATKKLGGKTIVPYEVKNVTAHFVNRDGSSLQNKEVTEGTNPKYSGSTPVWNDNVFFGWRTSDGTVYAKDEELPAISEETTYTAAYTVNYIDADGSTLQKTPKEYKVMTRSADISEGWYVLTNDLTVSDRVTCAGNVRLILCNGCTLTAEKGVTVNENDATLTVYGQQGNGGKLVAGAQGGAAIGSAGQRNSGLITINGGKITATGANACAGIGGGENGGGNVVINGGEVTAAGGQSSAAIGGQTGNSNVTVNGGKVSADGVIGAFGNGTAEIKLSWTAMEDRIYASSYNGEVTLSKQFTDNTKVFFPGAVGDNSAISRRTLYPFSGSTCTITFKNYDGTTVKALENFPVGGNPSYTGAAPEKPAEGEYIYIFRGWSDDGGNIYTSNPLPEATGDAVYTAVYYKAKHIKYSEPYVDGEGAYVLGTREHYLIDGQAYSVKDDGGIGDRMSDTRFSWFDFLLRSTGNYQILRYTGRVDGMTELLIPKTYEGKKVTILGNGEDRLIPNNGDQFSLVLNENIVEIKPYAFVGVYVKDVKGDTSGLDTIGAFAFSNANGRGNNVLDFTLLHEGSVSIYNRAFYEEYVTFHLKHSTALSAVYSPYGARSITYDFIDEHIYSGDPVWSWSDDLKSASVAFTCSVAQCGHAETFPATITNSTENGQTVLTAKAVVQGRTYTDTKTLTYTPAVEPFVDANGDYVLGTKAHYTINNKKYAVNGDGSVGNELESLELSYFEFADLSNGTLQINRYTGPTKTLDRLVIPKTCKGKAITVLGNDNNSNGNESKLFPNGNAYLSPFELVLNENITTIKNRTFWAINVYKVTGDTSGLNRIESYAFSWVNNPGGYTLDIQLDYPGAIYNGSEIFNHSNVILRVKHATSFISQNLGTDAYTYVFTDGHIYGSEPQPVWNWESDFSAASATFTCTDSRCKHEETVRAEVTSTDALDKVTYTATAVFENKTYTSVRDKQKNEHHIVFGGVENGRIWTDKLNDTAYEGETVELISSPDQGYRLETLTVKDGSNRELTVNGNKFVMPDSEVTVTASFAANSYTVTYEPSEDGRVTGVLSANTNSEVTVNVYPYGGYELEALTVKDSANREITVTDGRFTMPASDVTVSATFKKANLRITYNVTGHGTVSGASTAQFNDTVPLTVTPEPGYALWTMYAEEDDEWGELANIIDNELYMPGCDVIVYAEFVPITAMTEPYIDENGEYHLGTVEHIERDGFNFAVKDGVVGAQLDNLGLSYFDFVLLADDTYQINRYTGPTENLTQLVIPKTFNGRKITVLGNNLTLDDISKLIDPRNTVISPFELVLNENITTITNRSFWGLPVTKVSGDTSALNNIGSFAFSWANSAGGYALDIKLDHEGTISCGGDVFNHMNVTLHLKHATKFSRSTGAQSLTYDFTDAHIYSAPTWNWAADHSSATATFTCTDARCKHTETVDASVTVSDKADKRYFTATARINGETYTDIVETLIDGIGARLVGYTLSLDGDIGVNFHMELSDSVIADKDVAYMHFTIPTGEGPKEQKVFVRDAETRLYNGITYYIFKCRVAAKEMSSEIKAQIIDGDKQGVLYTYSVKEYADYLIENAYENDGVTVKDQMFAEAVPLARAMLRYGEYATAYFSGDDSLEDIEGVTIDEKYAQYTSDLPAEGVTLEGSTLSLKSETTLSLYFKSDETLSLTCDGKTVETVPNGAYQVARIRGIPAKELQDNFTLTVKAGEATYTVTYSPMNYCYDALNGETSNTLKNVVKALYLYSEAAKEYFNNRGV